MHLPIKLQWLIVPSSNSYHPLHISLRLIWYSSSSSFAPAPPGLAHRRHDNRKCVTRTTTHAMNLKCNKQATNLELSLSSSLHLSMAPNLETTRHQKNKKHKDASILFHYRSVTLTKWTNFDFGRPNILIILFLYISIINVTIVYQKAII